MELFICNACCVCDNNALKESCNYSKPFKLKCMGFSNNILNETFCCPFNLYDDNRSVTSYIVPAKTTLITSKEKFIAAWKGGL
jgi:hypothetical protein